MSNCKICPCMGKGAKVLSDISSIRGSLTVACMFLAPNKFYSK